MRVVVKVMSVIILYWKNVFFFFAYCFIIPDIELGIWLCSHRERERIPNPIEDEIYTKFKKMLNREKSGENDITLEKKYHYC